MRQKNQILVFALLLVLFQTLAFHAPDAHAEKAHCNRVFFAEGESRSFTSNPRVGDLYIGQLHFIDEDGSSLALFDKEPPLHSEYLEQANAKPYPLAFQVWFLHENGDRDTPLVDEHDLGYFKPPYLTSYFVETKVHGFGVVHLSIDDTGSTSAPDNIIIRSVEMDFDVGDFRNPDVFPDREKLCVPSTQSKTFNLELREKHTTIHRYDWPDYDPKTSDGCVPIANKGTTAEVLPGTESLKAQGHVSRSIVKILKGVSVTNSSDAQITLGLQSSASVGWGQSEGASWVWGVELDALKEESDQKFNEMLVIDGSFEVELSHHVPHSPEAGDPESDRNCIPCSNCGAPVAHDDEYKHAAKDENGNPMMCPDAESGGCGEPIWACDPVVEEREREKHRKRTCNRPIYNNPDGSGLYDTRCNAIFRECTGTKCAYENDQPHTDNWSPKTAGLSPSDSSYTAKPGDTVEANLVADGPYSQVYWYVRGPGETGYGTEVEIDTGDGSTAEASLSYTLPSDAAGEYTITAYIYRSDQSVYEESYTVTVSNAGLSSSDGSYTAKAGDAHRANLVADGPIYDVSWYVREPGADSDAYAGYSYIGDGVTDTASLSYTFPAGKTGDYIIKACIYRWSDMSYYEESYTVTVESVIGHNGH